MATPLPMGNDSRSSSKRGVSVLSRVVIFLSKYAHLTPHTPATFCHALTYAIMSAFLHPAALLVLLTYITTCTAA